MNEGIYACPKCGSLQWVVWRDQKIIGCIDCKYEEKLHF